MDKYHCTQKPTTKEQELIYPKDREANNLALCFLFNETMSEGPWGDANWSLYAYFQFGASFMFTIIRYNFLFSLFLFNLFWLFFISHWFIGI